MNDSITGIILAGGQSRRMGGEDKGRMLINGTPLIRYVIDRLEPQVGQIVISANHHIPEYQTFGYPVISDDDFPEQGPMSGIYNAAKHCDSDYLCVVPCDSPFIPSNLVERLIHAMKEQQTQCAVVHDGERRQHLYLLLKSNEALAIAASLTKGIRAVKDWIPTVDCCDVDFSANSVDFANLNTPEDIELISQRL